MTVKIISAAFAEHYTWGGSEGAACDGWHLVKTPELSVIEEQMPTGTSEAPHRHSRARQFFFVLEGELTLQIEQEVLLVQARQGVELSPGQQHQAFNRGTSPVRMLVISQPASHGDRILDERKLSLQ